MRAIKAKLAAYLGIPIVAIIVLSTILCMLPPAQFPFEKIEMGMRASVLVDMAGLPDEIVWSSVSADDIRDIPMQPVEITKDGYIFTQRMIWRRPSSDYYVEVIEKHDVIVWKQQVNHRRPQKGFVADLRKRFGW